MPEENPILKELETLDPEGLAAVLTITGFLILKRQLALTGGLAHSYFAQQAVGPNDITIMVTASENVGRVLEGLRDTMNEGIVTPGHDHEPDEENDESPQS